MANYANLQEAIDAGTSNMTLLEDRAQYTYYYFRGNCKIPIFHLLVSGMELETKSGNSFYHKYTVKTPDNVTWLELSFTGGTSSESAIYYTESGKINGHEFAKGRYIGRSPWWDEHGVEFVLEHDIFIFDTGEIYLRLIAAGKGNEIELKHTDPYSGEVYEISDIYTETYNLNYTFRPTEKEFGSEWSLLQDIPELPTPVDPGEAPTPTIIYDFQKNVRYRAKVRTHYQPPTGSERYIDSEPSAEFKGSSYSNLYDMYWGARIDVKTLEAWDPYWVDKKCELVEEGDVHGLHYKVWEDSDDTCVAVITGTQTEDIQATTDFPFMQDGSQHSAHQWYLDGHFTNLKNIMYNDDRFGFVPQFFCFGKNFTCTPILDYIWTHSTTWSGLGAVDIIAKEKVQICPTSFFASCELPMINGQFVMYMNRFLKSVEYVPSASGALITFDRMFYEGHYMEQTWQEGQIWGPDELVDFSLIKYDQPTTIGYMFYYCHDLQVIRLTGLTIKAMAYAFYACYNLIELTFKDSNAGTLSNTGLNWAFYGCSKLTSIDLSGFTYESSSYGVRLASTFKNCTKLEYIDLSSLKIDCSSSSYTKDAFTGCNSLKEIKCPESFRGYNAPDLPITMYDSNGNSYTKLTTGKTLYATNPVG